MRFLLQVVPPIASQSRLDVHHHVLAHTADDHAAASPHFRQQSELLSSSRAPSIQLHLTLIDGQLFQFSTGTSIRALIGAQRKALSICPYA